MSNTTRTLTYQVQDASCLEHVRAWVMTPSHHAQLIQCRLGQEDSWLVVITDYTAPEAIATDRAEQFQTQFGSQVQAYA